MAALSIEGPEPEPEPYQVTIQEPEFQGVFALTSVSVLPPSTAVWYSPVFAQFIVDHGGGRFQIQQSASGDVILLTIDFRRAQLFNLSPTESLCIYGGSDSDEEESYCSAIAIQCRNVAEGNKFRLSFKQWKKEAENRVQLGYEVIAGEVVVAGNEEVAAEVFAAGNEIVAALGNRFDYKINASSAKMYFHYYAQLSHQENILRDFVTIGTYLNAFLENSTDFTGRVVVDVGAGCGILSLFAAQAGARHVYAVEASEMAECARRLIAGNPSLGERITVIKGKVEEVVLPVLADILISEPMGTLLVNERMIESYAIARDRLLLPNGKMFPAVGRIYMAPFNDETLFQEIAAKALFWQQQNFYGVDLTPLSRSASREHYSQPVVGCFDESLLVASNMYHEIDFTSIEEEELYEIDIPLKFIATMDVMVHGLACWFDVLFNGSTIQRWFSTSPYEAPTHWSQIRFVLSQPIFVTQGQEINGKLLLVACDNQTYTIHLTLSVGTWDSNSDPQIVMQTASGTFELKEPYTTPSTYQPQHD